MISSPPESLERDPLASSPGYFRARLTSNASPEDEQEDAAIAVFEYERRWKRWWKLRRFPLGLLAVLPVLFLVTGMFMFVTGNNSSGSSFLWLALAGLALLLIWVIYCSYTLPRLVAFGRVYRRLVAVPLSRNIGSIWCDSSLPAPDFPSLRDNFFALFRDSESTSAVAQVEEEEEVEIARKKNLLGELSAMLAPLVDSTPQPDGLPFIPGNHTACLDHLRLEMINPSLAQQLAAKSLPPDTALDHSLTLTHLTHEVEDYAAPGEVQTKEKEPGQEEHPGQSSLHQQITGKMDENFEQVKVETGRWQARESREQRFYEELVAQLQTARQGVREGYERVTGVLEAEIRPWVNKLETSEAFYRSQFTRVYEGQRQEIESYRDSAVSKLHRELEEIEHFQEQRSEEQSELQAEDRALSEQRLRLEASTEARFTSLREQLAELTGRTYSIPPAPVFRSNLPVDTLTIPAITEEVLQGLHELRAEANLSSKAVNTALNRFGRLHFEPLDDLAQLEQELAGRSKWEAVPFLGNIINFRQSGQLLALAGEVSDVVGVYMDATRDFERLNNNWCRLEAAVRALGLASYASRLGESQSYLVSLSNDIHSLHSSLAVATHNPEMARPTTFQNLYDLAAGLERELEELSGLDHSIQRVQERLQQLSEELSELDHLILRNKTETREVSEGSESSLAEVMARRTTLEHQLDENKARRLKELRAHIDAFVEQQNKALGQLDEVAEGLRKVGDTTGKILKKHLHRAERLLEEARILRQGLEDTIVSIVQEFERGVLGDRSVLRPSEVFIPIWYFQFSERPLWKERFNGFAQCYNELQRFGWNSPQPGGLPSLAGFLLGRRPPLNYTLTEEPDLTSLVQAENLDYPSGQVNIGPGVVEKLGLQGWLNPWLVKVFLRQS